MKIALVGYGRMGHAVERAASEAGHEIVARFDPHEAGADADTLEAALSAAEGAIDFSVAEGVAATAAAARSARVDLVVGTTGWGESAVAALRSAADDIGIVHGPNFSEGVHIFLRLVREMGSLADAVGGYDAHVHEVHHRHKRDHPSGTARRVADALVDELATKTRWRSGPPEGPAEPETLYVTSARVGEVPGIHLVGLEGAFDRIELRHDARGREGFARGAVRALEWVRGRKGLFAFAQVMDDLLTERRTGEKDD